MKDKAFVAECEATTITTLRITEHWKGSGQIVIADIWFGSVKSAVQLFNISGLHSNLLVKTAHVNLHMLTTQDFY